MTRTFMRALLFTLALSLCLVLQGISLGAHLADNHSDHQASSHLSTQDLDQKAHQECAHSHCHAGHMTAAPLSHSLLAFEPGASLHRAPDFVARLAPPSHPLRPPIA
ncbi:hypothetical protein [Gallaecimonas xiamenensis]|uniref:hypothetical protein n=1 Tax=Gallaecimonas xiamenensis TaxID=1207039 RepID=UPI0004B63647|nr:hypothetical protein [Gallaecimonas xiamenensis]